LQITAKEARRCYKEERNKGIRGRKKKQEDVTRRREIKGEEAGKRSKEMLQGGR
jgi:hypothetical protein